MNSLWVPGNDGKVKPFSRGITIVAFRQANETVEFGDYSKPCFVSRTSGVP